MPKPVVIVGAGLAGLACARELQRAGVYYLLLDASDRPGGRIKSDNVDGFLLDRGFQVMLTAYPNADDVIDFDDLKIGAFQKGAGIFDGTKTTLLDSKASFLDKLKLLRGTVLPLADLKLAEKWQAQADAMSLAEISRLNDKTAEQGLRDYGFSEEFMTKFARPFYGGVFMDHELQTSRRQLLFVTKMMAEGDTGLPAEGIEAVPKAIVSELHKYLFRMDQRVSEILYTNGVATGVRTDTSEVIEAAAVVIATEADEAARLSDLPTVEGHNSSTTLYFETPVPCVDSATIILNGSGTGIVNEVVPVSNAAPSYAPRSRHLVAVTLVGLHDEEDEVLAAKVKAEVTPWFPEKGMALWRFIRTYRIRYHQMSQTPGILGRLPQNTTEKPGLYFAGEFTENSSIDGAIRSGVACGQAVLAGIQAETGAVA